MSKPKGGLKKVARTSNNMHAFIQQQQKKFRPLDPLILEALRDLLLVSFENGEDIPGIKALCTKINRSGDSIKGALDRLIKQKKVVDVSNNPRNRRFVLNEEEFLGDNVVK